MFKFFKNFNKKQEVKELIKEIPQQKEGVLVSSSSTKAEMKKVYEDFVPLVEEQEEDREELKDVFASTLTVDEMRQIIWDKYFASGGKEEILKDLPKFVDPKIVNSEHLEEKINPKEERQMQRSMNPEKRISAFHEIKKDNRKQKPAIEKVKNMSDKKKEKMAREKILEFYDSKEGQNRIM